MWIIIYLAKGREAVLKLRKALENEGILVMVRQKTEEENPQEAFYEVLVPHTEVEQAQDIIISKG